MSLQHYKLGSWEWWVTLMSYVAHKKVFSNLKHTVMIRFELSAIGSVLPKFVDESSPKLSFFLKYLRPKLILLCSLYYVENNILVIQNNLSYIITLFIHGRGNIRFLYKFAMKSIILNLLKVSWLLWNRILL